MEVTAEAVPRVRAARPAVWLTLGFMLLQAAWILTIPPFRGSDEFDHAYRAAGVAGGQWVATEPAENGRGLLIEVTPALVEAAGPQCSVLGYTGPDNCSPVRETDSGRVLVASGAATYFPLYYWVVGSVGEWADGTTSLYLMRVATALICAAFFFAAAWSLARGPNLWPLAGLALATTPVLIYSTSIVAPNGVEMTAALALWSSLLVLGGSDLAEKDETALVLIAIFAAASMSVLRLLGPLFVLAIGATSLAFRYRSLPARLRGHAWTVILGSSIVTMAAASFGWWLRGPANVAATDAGDGGGITIGPIDGVVWALQSVAAFPYRNQAGPPIIYGVVGALVLVLLFASLRAARLGERLVISVTFLGALLLPFAATWASSNESEVVWQGRYGLAFGVGFVLLSGLVVGERSRLRFGEPRKRAVPTSIVLLAYGVATAACYLKVRGNELSANSASGPSWIHHSPLALMVLVAVAMMCYYIAIVGHRGSELV